MDKDIRTLPANCLLAKQDLKWKNDSIYTWSRIAKNITYRFNAPSLIYTVIAVAHIFQT